MPSATTEKANSLCCEECRVQPKQLAQKGPQCMFVQTDLNFAPEVLRSVSVKNFKKNADVLVDSGDVLKGPNIF